MSDLISNSFDDFLYEGHLTDKVFEEEHLLNQMKNVSTMKLDMPDLQPIQALYILQSSPSLENFTLYQGHTSISHILFQLPLTLKRLSLSNIQDLQRHQWPVVIQRLRLLECVIMSGFNMGDSLLEALSNHCPYIQYLSLSYGELSEEMVEQVLQKCRQLRILHLPISAARISGWSQKFVSSVRQNYPRLQSLILGSQVIISR